MPPLGESPSDTTLPQEQPRGLSQFPAFTFPPPPARPGHVVLNRFVLYETKTRFFIVGTNAPAGTRFRVLKIDRTTSPDEPGITEDEAVYTKTEVDELLDMIANGNKSTGGMREITKFYGIIGLVRFTEGYYMTLITKRSPVALIGGHYIFHIDSTQTISIHSSTTPTSKLDKNSDEARYLQMFQMVDLTKNFYFSYSYDVTRTLQWNMTRNHKVEGRNRMFVWNQYLLENAFGPQTGIENQWALPIMYGFVDQSKLSILGRNVYVTLIARRSRFFAGARFLKRGVNDRGYVANDVETEQIVSEMSTTSFYGAGSLHANPNHTSFVQHRGSIPLFWTQDGTNMSPKPPIELNVVDPYFSAAALHFDDMFKRYGAPCIVLNLIKAKEKTPRESLLLKEFSDCIEYLNQFLPEDKKIWHIKWDMSRASKSPNENVISVLEIIAEKTFAQTGFFHSGHHLNNQKNYNPDSTPVPQGSKKSTLYISGLQNGVVRTNCIDCLDRTNAAQFIIAKCALGHQLYSLGLVSEPVVPFDCDVTNMLTEMYHDHGDTIALQYGGSHLVNTMETYRKINQWTSHSRDMIESIRRFYSNSFVDAEKQDAMNLFLGNYRVRKGSGPALWELPGDYHLHNITDPEMKQFRKSYTKWWTPDALLPQEVLARKSFLEEEAAIARNEYLACRFRLEDAGYDEPATFYDDQDYDNDEYDGQAEEGEYYEDDEEGEEQEQDRNGDHHADENSDQRLDSLDPNLKSLGHGRRRRRHPEISRDDTGTPKAMQKEDHIEHLHSEDDDDYSTQSQEPSRVKPERVDSMESTESTLSDQSVSTATQDSVQCSNLGTTPKAQSLMLSNTPKRGHRQRSEGQRHDGIKTSQSNPNVRSLSTLDVSDNEPSSGRVSSLDGSYVDFQDRIVPPLNFLKPPRPSTPTAAVPRPHSSASSISSSLRHYYPSHVSHPHLRHSGSRSSVSASSYSAISRPESAAAYYYYANSGGNVSRGEKYAYDMMASCSKDDDEEDGGGASTGWEEYWDEYYRPKVQTSFQRLFAYNMNSTSRYMPPGIKNSSEQSPFEVRLNHSLPSQAEINARAAAKSEKPSMLSWLGLVGNNGNGNNGGRRPASTVGSKVSSNSSSALSNGSKTLPLSAGRKKGFLASLDEGDESSVKSNSRNKDGVAHHSRSSRLSIASFPVSEYDEKTSVLLKSSNGQKDEKVRLPTHIPRSKEEEWELTKNVWTNLPKFAIHDPNFVPLPLNIVVGTENGKGFSEATAATDGLASGETGGTKGRSAIEDMVKKSLQPDVTSQETKEYKRYTQQFKSIRFDSVPVKGAASFGINAHASQTEECQTGTNPNTTSTTPVSGSIANGLNAIQAQSRQKEQQTSYQQQYLDAIRPSLSVIGRNDDFQRRPKATMSSSSTATLGTVELNDEEEFYYAASRIGQPSTERPQQQQHQQSIHGHRPTNRRTSTLGTNTGEDEALNATCMDSIDIGPYPEPPIILAPIQTVIKVPSESEMVLYNAHVELPKLTLYTVGQTSLNPYWGASSGTRARYDAYMMWILKGRYGNLTAAAAAAAQQQHLQQASRAGSSGTLLVGVGGSGGEAGVEESQTGHSSPRSPAMQTKGQNGNRGFAEGESLSGSSQRPSTQQQQNRGSKDKKGRSSKQGVGLGLGLG
ncbi:phosphatidylinositol 3,5-bisphosphate 5-phosphatase [Entomortierella parvispora]|uniref:Phosphatidylinositol 3,5-bisphosphate 5-phosphatase n=1 Tax=Entomortierella parvispora TaxID=205924 RepID=A0A9P3H3B2_9FUNG|nr:phosphatidylinositol 3,5-bisphosphate 5-phosphatase [Entomortierella parvispora]